MRVDQEPGTQPRLLRKPALGEVSTASHLKTEKKAKKPKGSRFVGPAQLDDDQRSQLRGALESKQVGDEIGRQIFIGAVEYQISAFAHLLEHRIEPKHEPPERSSPPQKTLQEIFELAHSLSDLLRALPDDTRAHLVDTLATQDRLGRGYDERYLCELGCEIARLENACATAGRDPEPVAREPDPGPSREFVAKLAGVFSECFEMEPTAREDGPFRTSLEALGEVTGLVIGHEPAFLAQVLAAEAPNRRRG